MHNEKNLIKKNKKDFELNVALSYKVKNGSIKVSEKDLVKLGLGIVEEVIIAQVGAKEGLTVMLFSDSHIKSGNVIMSIADAQGIEVEEGDKVTVKKLGAVKSSKKILKPKPTPPKPQPVAPKPQPQPKPQPKTPAPNVKPTPPKPQQTKPKVPASNVKPQIKLKKATQNK